MAAAVANLTLLAATADAAVLGSLWLVLSLLVALLAMRSEIPGRVGTITHISDYPHHHRHFHLAVPRIRSLQAVSRPAF